MGVLTVSGNEITDLVRANALAWAKTQQGGSVDQFSADSSFGIFEAGTNLHTRGQCDAISTAWDTDAGFGIALTIDATTPAPFSPQSVLVTKTRAGNSGARGKATGLSAAAGTLGFGSIRFKGSVVGGTYAIYMGWINSDATSTNGSATATLVVATGGWQYVEAPPLAVAVGKIGASLFIYVEPRTGQTNETYWMAHAMLQTGVTVISPYVATSGGVTAARTAGRVRTPASLINATQGWVAFRVRAGFPATDTIYHGIFEWGDDANNYLQLYFSGADQKWHVRRASGGTVDETSVAATHSLYDFVTLIFAWDAGHLYLSINGGVFINIASIHIPVLAATTFDIGNKFLNAAGVLDGDVLWTTCGTGTLTNADATTLNALGNADPALGLLGSAAQTTMVWTASTPIDNSYINAPTTNDINGSTAMNAPGVVYSFGGGTQPATGTFAGLGTSLQQGGGNELATATLIGSGVVYDMGGEAFFADTILAGAGSTLDQGGAMLEAESAFEGLGDTVRPYGPRLRGRIVPARTGKVDNP